MSGVTQADLTQLQSFVSDMLDAFLKETGEVIKIAERSIEALEKQLGVMSVAFLEQAAILEALIHIIPEEFRSAFDEYYTTRRADVLTALKEGSDAISGSGN